MVLPQLTAEQRQAALAKAAEARQARLELKQQLKQGQVTLAQAFGLARDNDLLAKTRVSALLEAVPGVGKVKRTQVMADLGIAPTRRVGGLGHNQRDALVAQFDK